jgi:hypothetical protein
MRKWFEVCSVVDLDWWAWLVSGSPLPVIS